MKKKEYVETVLPTSGDGVDYEVISRKVTEDAHKQWPTVKSDPYDEIVEVRKKTCYGNPEEVFETFETVRYRRYKPVPELPTEVKRVVVKEDVKAQMDLWRLWAKALGEKDGTSDRESDIIAGLRTLILIAYMITNVAIVANAVRHWNPPQQEINRGT